MAVMNSSEYNPYLAARREWDERYGDQITRARNWRTAAMFTSLIALLSVAGLLWMSARSRVMPFVVLVDNLGRPVASGFAEPSSVDDRLKRAQLYNWVNNLRTVISDGIAQKKAVDAVYAQIASGSAAQEFVSDFYRNNTPFHRAKPRPLPSR
jgi:type IV secretion system protein TrbF